MESPPLDSVFRERKVFQTVADDDIVIKHDAYTGLCHENICRCHRNMITGKNNVDCFGKADGRHSSTEE